MTTLAWIVVSTFLMSLLSWVGLLFMGFNEELLRKTVKLLVAFAAGSLIGVSFLHLIPETVSHSGTDNVMFGWLLGGFTLFFLMEQFFQWHHTHRVGAPAPEPHTYLILIADGTHNFMDGLAIGASFLISPQAGMVTWVAAAAHEIPQEFGDYGILVHGGWSHRRALVWNFITGLPIVAGGVLAYLLGGAVDTTFLLPFAAGNFIYIAASDLIPEIKRSERFQQGLANAGMFLFGLLLIGLIRSLAH